MGAWSPPHRPSLRRLKIMAPYRCTRAKPPLALGARCTAPPPVTLLSAAASVLVCRLRERWPRSSILRSAAQAVLMSEAVTKRPAVTAYSSAHALRLGWPSSWVAGAVEQQRTRCEEAAVAESASDVTDHALFARGGPCDGPACQALIGLARVS